MYPAGFRLACALLGSMDNQTLFCTYQDLSEEWAWSGHRGWGCAKKAMRPLRKRLCVWNFLALWRLGISSVSKWNVKRRHLGEIGWGGDGSAVTSFQVHRYQRFCFQWIFFLLDSLAKSRLILMNCKHISNYPGCFVVGHGWSFVSPPAKGGFADLDTLLQQSLGQRQQWV
jgi:hypothetical protein